MLAVIGVAVVAVVLAGAFAITSLASSDGTDSPEAAVDALFAALDDEDAIGALESLAPGEREMLLDPIRDIQHELTRLDVVGDFELEEVPGFDLQSADLSYRTVELADGLSRVEVIGGTLTATSIPADLPFGSLLEDQLAEDPSGESPETVTTDFADHPVSIVTVQRDGNWHVSLAYTLAEAARESSGMPVPRIGEGPEPVGSASPEDAVRDMADALTQITTGSQAANERIISLLPPDELAVVYDYAAGWFGGSGDGPDSVGPDETLVINDLDLSVEGNGRVRRVSIDGFDIELTGTGTSISSSDRFSGRERQEYTTTTRVIFDGECVSVRSTSTRPVPDEEDEKVCRGDDLEDGGLSALSRMQDLSLGITVVETDGRWYVSPVRTVLDTLVEALATITVDDLESLLGSLDDSTMPLIGPSGTIDPRAARACEAIVDDLAVGTPDAERDAAMEDFEACMDGAYHQGSGSGSGSIPATSIPTTSLVPASSTSVPPASVPTTVPGG